jgi:serine/threonine-protein kinase RsbW
MQPSPEQRVSPPAVRMVVPATPSNVTLLRQAATGVAEAVGFTTEAVEDVRLAVTEACTNVVVHAYGTGEEGDRIELEAVTGPNGALTFWVRDDGRGFQEQSGASGLGLGLPLIAALARDSELRPNPRGRGSEIRMAFAQRPQGLQ